MEFLGNLIFQTKLTINKHIQQLVLLTLISFSVSPVFAQLKSNKLHSKKNIQTIDSLKIDLSISFRRDVASYKHYKKLSHQDTINYQLSADTLLGRVRMFKIMINQKASLGKYKKSFIKEVKLEFRQKGNTLNIESEKNFRRPLRFTTIWNGKKNKKPHLLAKADQVIITLTTISNNETTNSEFVINL